LEFCRCSHQFGAAIETCLNEVGDEVRPVEVVVVHLEQQVTAS
jgi:hypothetical protein